VKDERVEEGWNGNKSRERVSGRTTEKNRYSRRPRKRFELNVYWG